MRSGPDVELDLSDLERRIEYQFGSHDFLKQALTHASIGGADGENHYERLEFLGDRVLGLAVAEILHREFPVAPEGELSVRFNSLVNGRTLAEISDQLRLFEFIRVAGNLQELTGKRMQSVRADVLEALLAAIYLDGGFAAAQKFVNRFWSSRLHRAAAARRDSKTELQEWAHANQLGSPEYVELSREGPDHEPRFKVAVRLPGMAESQGIGRSKRAAEQNAAATLLVAQGVRAPAGENSR